MFYLVLLPLLINKALLIKKSTISLPERVKFFESSLIEEALTNNNGSIKGTMGELMLARKTLYDKMKKYDLVREKFLS